MVDEQALRERAALGAKYKPHLEDLHAAIDAVKLTYISEWQNTFDANERENLWRSVRICEKMKGHFGGLVSAGTLASHQITELKRLG